MKRHHIIITVLVLICAAALVGFFALQNREELQDDPAIEYNAADADALAK